MARNQQWGGGSVEVKHEALVMPYQGNELRRDGHVRYIIRRCCLVYVCMYVDMEGMGVRGGRNDMLGCFKRAFKLVIVRTGSLNRTLGEQTSRFMLVTLKLLGASGPDLTGSEKLPLPDYLIDVRHQPVGKYHVADKNPKVRISVPLIYGLENDVQQKSHERIEPSATG